MEFITDMLKSLCIILLSIIGFAIAISISIVGYAISIFVIILIALFVLKLIGWIFGIPLLFHIFTTLRNIKL